MKRLLFLILLLPCLVYGQTVGIKVAAPIIKNSPSDNTVTGYADLLNGGYHITPTISGRDSLNTAYSKTLKTGMLCYVTGVDSTYRWSGTDWGAVLSGGITPEILSDSLSNYTPLQDGLISGGSAIIGTGSVTVDTAYYRINKVKYMSLPRTFSGISNSASGTQYYVLIYGKNDNTLDTLHGVQDTIAVIPTKPNGTVAINTVLVGDGGVETATSDLSGYAKLSDTNLFTKQQKITVGSPGEVTSKNYGQIESYGYRFYFRNRDIFSESQSDFVIRTSSTDNEYLHFYKGTGERDDLTWSKTTGIFDFKQTPTINGVPIGTDGTPDTTIYRTVANSYSLASGQPRLVSGTNIKTVNSNSLLGSGDITTEVPLTFASPLSRSTNTISIPPATTSANGYLTSTDWNTFKDKQDALGYTPYNPASYPVNAGGETLQSVMDRGNIFSASSPSITLTKTGVLNWYLGNNIGDVGANNFSIGTDASSNYNILNLLTNGNIGIGTTDPQGYKLRVNGTVKADNDITVTGNATASSFIKSGGTSSQFLKADGSSDSNTYLTSSTGVSSITGTTNQVTASASTGAVTLSLPQSIATTSTPQFGGLGIGASSSSTTFFNTSAGTTSKSSFRIPNGVAPTTPVSGDWWSLTTGLRTQTYDGTQTKDVIFDKANSVFAGLGTGMIATNNSGDLSVVPIADRLTTNVITKTANYTVTLSDVGANGEVLVMADATSGNITITLPVASTSTGLNFIVKKTDSSANTVTVSVASTIDGASTKVYSTQYSGGRITSNGTSYSITGAF